MIIIIKEVGIVRMGKNDLQEKERERKNDYSNERHLIYYSALMVCNLKIKTVKIVYHY